MIVVRLATPLPLPTVEQHMDVDVLLCDHAQVAGKLFISGANIDRFLFPAGTPPRRTC